MMLPDFNQIDETEAAARSLDDDSLEISSQRRATPLPDFSAYGTKATRPVPRTEAPGFYYRNRHLGMDHPAGDRWDRYVAPRDTPPDSGSKLDLSAFGTRARAPGDVPLPRPRPDEAPPATRADASLSDYPVEFGKGVVAGAKNLLASSLKGLAGSRADRPSFPPGQSPLELAMRGEDAAFDQYLASPQGPPQPITNDPIYQAGQAVEDIGKSVLAPRPGFEPGQSWTRDIGSGFGSVAAGIATYMIPGIGPSLAGGMFVTSGMGEATDKAVHNKATPEQIAQAARFGTIAGATDIVDALLPMLGSTGKALGFVKRVGLAAVGGAVAEGGQEGLQQLIQNAIAKGIYKPDQDMFEDVPRSVAIGAIVGGTTSGGFSAMQGKQPQTIPGNDNPPVRPDVPVQPQAAGRSIESIRPAETPVDPRTLNAPAPVAPRGSTTAPAVRPTESSVHPDEGTEVPAVLTGIEQRVLRKRGFTDEMISDMSRSEIDAELGEAAKQGVEPTPEMPDQPTAEPASDIAAQVRDLQDENSGRAAVWLPPATVEHLRSIGSLDEATKAGVAMEDFDDQGGILIAKDKAVAREARKLRTGNVDLQQIIGALTGSGHGKPAAAASVVQQTDENGNVTQESAVTAGEAPAIAVQMQEPGRTVEEKPVEQALGERAAKVVAEQSETGQTMGALSEMFSGKPQTEKPDFSGQGTVATGAGTKTSPAKVNDPIDIERISSQVNTEPTDAQKAAGNYKKGHLKFKGLDIAIENPAGSIRTGKKPDGSEWKAALPVAYGYIKRTIGKDGDQVDVYLGDQADSSHVFIIDQIDPHSGRYDEAKVMLGFADQVSAERAYDAAFSDGNGPARRQNISPVSLDELKGWLRDGNTTKPYAKASYDVDPATEAKRPFDKMRSDGLTGEEMLSKASQTEEAWVRDRDAVRHLPTDERGYFVRATVEQEADAARADQSADDSEQTAARRLNVRPPRGGFRTSNDSTYRVHRDATTTRRDETREHDRSERTFYLTPENAKRVPLPKGKFTILDHENGSITLAGTKPTGAWTVAPSARNVKIEAKPEVGLIPLEVWARGRVGSNVAYSSAHLGEPIAEIDGTPPDDKARRAPDQNARGEDPERSSSYQAIAGALSEVGMSPDAVDQADIATAVKIMDEEGLPAAEAFEQAVVRNAREDAELADEMDAIFGRANHDAQASRRKDGRHKGPKASIRRVPELREAALNSGFAMFKVGGGLTPAAEVRRADIEAQLALAVRHLVGPHIRVAFSDTIPLPNGTAGWGSFGEAADTAAGVYVPAEALIKLALNDPAYPDNPLPTAFHESFHAIEHRLLTPEEFSVLDRETPRLREFLNRHVQFVTLDGKRAAPGWANDIAGHEVRAIAFEHYAMLRASGQPVAGVQIGVRRVFEKLVLILRRITNALRGLGFQTTEDVFREAYEGEIGTRDIDGAETIPEQASIHHRAARPGDVIPPPESISGAWAQDKRFKERLSDAVDAALLPRSRALWDQQIDLARFQKAVEAMGREVPESLDTYLAATLYPGKVGERMKDTIKELWVPLYDAMASRKVSRQDLADYLYARHAPERNAKVREIDPHNDAGSGMTDDEAAEIMARLAPRIEDFRALGSLVDDIVRHNRNLMVRKGLESERTVDTWSNAYRFYVPLKGLEESTEDEFGSPTGGSGFDVRRPESRRALGRANCADDVLANLLDQTQRTVVRSEKNHVAKTFLRFAEANASPFWKVGLAEQRRRISPVTGLVEHYWVVASPDWHNVFAAKVGGKTYSIEIKHPGLLEALKNLGADRLNPFLRFVGRVTREYARFQTAKNPEFVFTNLVRDLQDAGFTVNAEMRDQFLKRYAANILNGRALFGAVLGVAEKGDSTSYRRWFEEWREDGGKISHYGLKELEQIKAEIEKELNHRIKSTPKKVAREALTFFSPFNGRFVKFLEALSDVTETTTRLAVYIAGRESGMTREQAARMARNATVDFNRRGKYGGHINVLYAFANANIQGNVRLLRTLRRSKVARRTAIAIIIAGMLMTYWNMAMSPEDKESKKRGYEKRPYWERERNLIIYWPGAETAIKIPLGYGLNALWMIGEQAAMRSLGKVSTTEALGNALGTVASAFNPLGSSGSFFDLGTWVRMYTPTVARPVPELWRNRNWIDRPIHPDEMSWTEGIPHSERHKALARQYAVGLAQFLNRQTGGNKFEPGTIDLYPDDLEYAWNFAVGGLGKFLDNSQQAIRDYIDGVETPVERMPFVRRFIVSDNSPVVDQETFYAQRREVQAKARQLRNAIRARVEGTDDGSADTVIEKLAPQLGARPGRRAGTINIDSEIVFRATDQQIKNLRSEMDKVRKDTSLNRAEREARIRVLQQQIREVMGRARVLVPDAQAK